MVAAWRTLEDTLLYVTDVLLNHVAHQSELCFPFDPFWPTPTECGYKRTWRIPQEARRAAFRSLDACRVLLARCTMAIGLATPEKDTNPPSWMNVLLRANVNAKWVENFRSSLIPDLSPGLRVGAYVSPSREAAGTHWIEHIPCMIRANVPVYIHWPKNDRDKIVRQWPFLHQYLPSP
ncbi:hypothetical protein L227DRAFT_514740, partial [Lentinus tigrinus ALCF2SS1-6]